MSREKEIINYQKFTILQCLRIKESVKCQVNRVLHNPESLRNIPPQIAVQHFRTRGNSYNYVHVVAESQRNPGHTVCEILPYNNVAMKPIKVQCSNGTIGSV